MVNPINKLSMSDTDCWELSESGFDTDQVVPISSDSADSLPRNCDLGKIIISNPVILTFCKDNPSFCPETALLQVISLLKSMSKSNEASIMQQFQEILAKQLKDNIGAEMQSVKSVFDTLHQRNVNLNQQTSHQISHVKSAIEHEIQTLKSNVESLQVHSQNLYHAVNNIPQQQTQNMQFAVASQVQPIKQTLDHLQQTSQYLSQSLNDITSKLNVTANKGSTAEELTFNDIVKMFPQHIVTRPPSSQQKGAADIVLEHDRHPKILLEVKFYKNTVCKSEIEKFERDLKTAQTHGVFISQTSRIQSKPHFHIDIVDQKHIAIYLSNLNFENESIVTAVNTIYMLYPQLIRAEAKVEGRVIQQSDLEKITKVLNDHQTRVKQLETHLKEAMNHTKHLSLETIRNILSFNSSATTCAKCDKEFKNKKSFDAHVKKCN